MTEKKHHTRVVVGGVEHETGGWVQYEFDRLRAAGRAPAGPVELLRGRGETPLRRAAADLVAAFNPIREGPVGCPCTVFGSGDAAIAADAPELEDAADPDALRRYGDALAEFARVVARVAPPPAAPAGSTDPLACALEIEKYRTALARTAAACARIARP